MDVVVGKEDFLVVRELELRLAERKEVVNNA